MPKLPRNKRCYVRIYKDEDSRTGISAAVLIKNVRPKKCGGGYYHIANAEFNGNFYLNCDGYKLRPKVEVKVWCDMPEMLVKAINKKKQMERALAGSPMLI